jgi:hypothetical protein
MSAPDPDMADRLKAARIAAQYTSAAAAAMAMGVDYPTYAGHENGNRGFARRAPQYARFFKVRPDWLLTGRGRMKADQHPAAEIFDRIPSDAQPEALRYLEFLAERHKK